MNLKVNFKLNLKFLKPDWRKIIIFIILFLVLPQKVSSEFIFFGGVYIIKFLFESHPPALDLIMSVVVLIVSYLLACLLVWVYDTKVNKYILSEGEVEVQPPEEKKGEEKEESEDTEEEGEE